MNKYKEYSALIIGAGRMASDYDNPSDGFILSHAHAILINKNIRLCGF